MHNGRTTTNNIFTSFDPQLTSNISATYTQPLLRNFKIDGMRQQLLVSQKNREIADTQLQQSIANTVRSVRNAYYDLMYSIGNLNVQRQSLELAQQSLKDNRARVEIGTMAPLDIVQAEAEVATREEAVILAEAAIERQQDAVRALVFNPKSPDFWTARIEPTEPVTFLPTDGRHRRRGDERAEPAHGPGGGAEEHRGQRCEHPLLRQPVDAGSERLGELRRAGDRRRRVAPRAVERARSRDRSTGTVERSYWDTLGRSSAATSRVGPCRST